MPSNPHRVAMITGGNSGIGFATARKLAACGFLVILASRNQPASQKAIARILAGQPDARVEWIPLDLASFAAVRQCAAAFQAKGYPLHLLINHAGGLIPGKQARFTTDGFEMMFGMNHLGHFLLTNLLIDDLRRSAPARVITVSSQMHIPGYRGAKGPDFDYDNLKGEKYYNANIFYRNSKLANMWFTYELQRRLAGAGVTSNAICPGFVPAAIAGLLGAHLGLLWLQRHTEFPGPGRDDRTMVGSPMVPQYALRTTGYFLLLAGVITAFGAWLQVNPVWLYGPFRATDATTSAQPDWYMGWLEGAVRMFPGWDIQIGGFLLPAIFWPAVVLPGLIFTPLFLWPWLDSLALRDNRFVNVLQYPSQRPGRMAVGAGFFTFLTVLLVGGGDDVFASAFGWSLPVLLRTLQILVIVLPPLVAALTYAIARRRSGRWLVS